jgi:hypothetical protein
MDRNTEATPLQRIPPARFRSGVHTELPRGTLARRTCF